MVREPLEKCFVVLFGLSMLLTALGSAGAAEFLVEDGRANAEIVIAEEPTRAADLAARELQKYIEKLSGARLAIVTEPTGDVANKVYVGKSTHTERLGVSDQGLEFGAFRMKSGKDWLALVGYDEDFVPVEPWARSRNDWQNNTVHEWDRLSGGTWSNPLAAGMHRNYHPELKIWRLDKRGSLNAAYALLHGLGVRWYMPGDLGEIVPEKTTIELPQVDKTVRPDIAMRTTCFDRYHSASADDVLFALRLGTNRVYGVAHHGMRYLVEREEQRQAHPEIYATYDGKPDTDSRRPHVCLSSEALFDQNVKFVRALFDIYDADLVSVMPHDGFTTICQCPECRVQATLDRGMTGWYSDYVWAYVKRVAEELAKTHPDKKIMCGAYSTYQLPPLKIDKLPPNVLVQITNGMPRWEMDDRSHEELAELRSQWLEKTPNKLSLTMNYPFTQRGEFRPQYFPHVIARGLRAIQDEVWRMDLWIPEQGGMHLPGVTHLNAYMLGRFMWDAAQDADAVLGEYYRLFYGPAAEEMKAFIEYSEANYSALTKEKENANRCLELFEEAKQAADPESVYGQRIALVDDFLNAMRKRAEQLNKPRCPAPEFQAWNFDNSKWDRTKEDFKLDGKLDEEFWSMRGGFKVVSTGEDPQHGTRFQVLMGRDAAYFGILCRDEAGNPANIATTTDGDPAMWSGDHIEILIESDEHSYYQMVFNPAGAQMSLDRGAAKRNWYDWTSKAEVGAHVGEDYWSLEIRIPYTESKQDPLHLVIGRKPKASLPWYFNIARKRVRGEDVEVTAFAPTGEASFHKVEKFARLWSK